MTGREIGAPERPYPYARPPRNSEMETTRLLGFGLEAGCLRHPPTSIQRSSSG
jgi:hypothetical protein